jgi:hypothetical protein
MSQEYFITDKNGRRIAVQIPIRKYEKLLADAEELRDLLEGRKIPNNSRTHMIKSSGNSHQNLSR